MEKSRLRQLCLPVALLMSLASNAAFASPPPAGSEDATILGQYSDWVAAQQNSVGENCCSIADGRLVDARIKNGHWQVRFHKGNDIGAPTDWTDVPDSAVLHEQNPTGLPIAWWWAATVRCFTPPDGV